ncbi:Flavin-dependent oxidoreductase, luciferase family (includes alkanesulfonate monooxygenase SsuD and methylene tetrahydromethanopterin reductase) [Haloechinothrix alba]|uniref:Flavin-dependent oxidoreductase, luciferase family (Includes alkanesulfonate monooxygenase SsuD and methylene tetrahydromethanopterin reductase) n=1 Tax=Haloechinothrix alba TaxID=664784 RepID=A0A238Y3K3_9PSEU|nr:LLM class flavin-dependent oxidoreductase [Haloechinothrix alba]SNR65600.1 Flavin-dependent oxidoreductase, luciferase family (includes alkanesulfonate monooxygenase SsuD and methylene tetrahydromethanopterin reductase) [Haloechinothrix alba]
MSNEPPVGVFVTTSTPPEKIPSVAAAAEELGYGEVWVAEDYFCYGGFTGAALALQATERIKVGLGVVASTPRHPAVTAMEIATLARTYPGRFLPGIGHGVPFWTHQMGLTAKSPLTALTECIDGVRRLLAGETLDVEGDYFAFRSVAATHCPEQEVPLLTGVVGPKSLRLSGRIADGTVMSVLTGTAYLDGATKHIHEGMAETGRTNHLTPTLALFSIDKDSKRARDAVREVVAQYITVLGPKNPLTGAFGYNDHVAELLEREPDRFAEAMPDEWIDTLAVAGNPDEVAARITELRAAGATSVVLAPVNGDTVQDELRLTASAVLPHL